MEELEITQPEESVESTESTERTEGQKLVESTHEPGARVEQTQEYEEAEAVESALTVAIDAVEEAEVELAGEERTIDRTDQPAKKDPSEAEYETGLVKQPPDWDHGPPEDKLKETEAGRVADTLEVPEDVEIKPTDEDGTVDRDEYETIEGAELREASGDKDDDDGEEATPINLPGPVTAQAEVASDDVKDEAEERGGVLPVPIPEPTGAQEWVRVEEVGDSQARVADDGSELMREGEVVVGEAQVAGGEGGRESEVGVNMEPIPSSEEKSAGREGNLRVEGEQVGEEEEPGPLPFPQPAGEGEEPSSEAEVGEVAEDSGTLETAPDAQAEEGGLQEEDLNEGEEHWEPPAVYLNADGVVVDADGKPVDSPPVVTSPDGQNYVASYPGMYDKDGNPVSFEVPDYKGSLEGLYLHDDGGGKLTVVNANGEPVDSPPIVTSPDGQTYNAHYPGGKQVSLKAYQASVKDMYLHDDGSGKLTVVDANGKPVDSPPILTSPDGQTYGAYYPGDKPVSMKMYKAPIKDMYVHVDGSGKSTVVDANGDPVDSPPKVFSDGQGNYGAQYPGDKPVSLKTYKTPIKDMYLHTDSSGKMTVVDANGKPVDSPPIIFSPDGQTYGAKYPGGKPVTLKLFKPPSDWKKKI